MKKSLIKSLLPVLIVVLALSMISITVVADNYTGYVYDPENPCETIDQIKYDGLNRVKTALPDEEKPGKYDGLNEEKCALEPTKDNGKYDGLDEEKYALEPAAASAKFDGLGISGQPLEACVTEKYDGLNEDKTALEASEDNGKYDGLNGDKTALEPTEDNGKFDGLREPVVCPPVDCVIEDGLADDIDGLA